MSVDRIIYCPNLKLKDLYDFIEIFDNKATQRAVNIGLERVINYIEFKFVNEDRMISIQNMEINSTEAKKEAKKNGWKYSETDAYQYINYYKLPDKTSGLRMSIKHWGFLE